MTKQCILTIYISLLYLYYIAPASLFDFEQIARFAQEIVDAIPIKVTAVMKKVKSGLDDPRIQSKDPDPEEVLEYLSDLESTLHEARENATNFTLYQEALDVDDLQEYVKIKS